jgi:hypothetical protein
VITDAVLNFFFTALIGIAQLFPEGILPSDALFGGPNRPGLTYPVLETMNSIMGLTNYLFPLYEVLQMLLWLIPIWLGIILLREVRAWMPF